MEESGRLDLNALHTFYRVAQLGSFTAAAKMLMMPKSSVSRQIRLLEHRLGTRLIERTTRQLALTEIGEQFLAHCERVISEAADAERSVASYTSAPRGLLRVGVPNTFARLFLAPILPAFCRSYPEVKLELLLRGDRLDPVRMLLDLVIDVGRRSDSSYTMRKIGSMKQGLFASRSYLKRCPAPESPAGLAKHSVITMSRSASGSRWHFTDDSGRTKDLPVDPKLAVNDPVIAHSLAAAGLGIAILPEFLTKNDRTLLPVLPQWTLPPIEFFAVYPERRLTTPKLRAFLDTLQANLRF